jgi:hypothetical protein
MRIIDNVMPPDAYYGRRQVILERRKEIRLFNNTETASGPVGSGGIVNCPPENWPGVPFSLTVYNKD